MLGDRFLVLNGDVLCDLDLTALIAQHESTGARATIALYPVADPTGYGLIHRHADGEVTEFLEKPEPEQIDTDEINAGAYLLERSVLEEIPPERAVSIEHEVFPRLIGRGLYGIRLDGYWIRHRQPRIAISKPTGTSSRVAWRRRSAPIRISRSSWERDARSPRPRSSYRPSRSARACRVGDGASSSARFCSTAARWRTARSFRTASSARGSRWRAEQGSTARSSQRGSASDVGRDRAATCSTAVRAMPDHLRDALWRIESARAGTMEAPAAFVCGMGGSAIGGDLAIARPLRPAHQADVGRPRLRVSRLGARPARRCSARATRATPRRHWRATRRPRRSARTGSSPPRGGELAELARADGVPVIGLPAGLQPRAAVGYMFCVAAEFAALALAGRGSTPRIDTAASQLSASREAAENRARELAAEIGDATIVVYGSDLTASVAYRWKTQINRERQAARLLIGAAEADHNEIEGWAGADARFAAIFLGDRDQHPRERKRFELTAKAIEPYAATVINVETEGETRTDRLLHAVMLGDLLAIELANTRGVDPLAVDVLEGFKKEMGQPG